MNTWEALRTPDLIETPSCINSVGLCPFFVEYETVLLLLGHKCTEQKRLTHQPDEFWF